MSLDAFAPAKINLFLHVGPVQPDGYHPVCSWMTFADVGDRLRLARAGPALVVEGPFAADLGDTPPETNLVIRAAAALMKRAGRPDTPPPMILHKALPVASGLGGGSGDAGAALRLLRNALTLDVSDAELEAAAGEIGADGPACLWARPVLGEGRGDRLSPAPLAPVLDAVLVNPGVACPTGAVYRAYDAAPVTAALRPEMPEAFDDARAVADFLSRCRNDLEAPAASVAREIHETLSLLRDAPTTLLARLSGSGATCFALVADAEAAERLAGEVAAARPGWWVKACRLGGVFR